MGGHIIIAFLSGSDILDIHTPQLEGI